MSRSQYTKVCRSQVDARNDAQPCIEAKWKDRMYKVVLKRDVVWNENSWRSCLCSTKNVVFMLFNEFGPMPFSTDWFSLHS